jgi:hypothetical protein
METRTKYPRTFHLPWSLGATSDDKVLKSVDHFFGKEVVVTEKMDGENTTLYRDGFHARSIDSKHHESQAYVKRLQGEIGHLIPENFRICGENLFAKHSIHYNNLTSYFMVFNIWEGDKCLSWEETVEWAELLGLQTVPVLYNGAFDEERIKSCYTKNRELDEQEGYVVRVSESFSYGDFHKSVAKFVRKNHVQTEEHWKNQIIVKNGVK